MLCDMEGDVSPGFNPVTVFWLNLDQQLSTVQELFELLSAEEKARTSVLHDDLIRNRAIVRLARRRQLLSEILDVDAGDVGIHTRPNGKPFVLARDGQTLEISSSNSRGHGVLAVTKNQSIGVDIESLTQIPDSPQFASWISNDSELAEIRTLSPLLQRRTLLRMWTRKEAYLKATGEGLRSDLRSIEVPMSPEPTDEIFFPTPDGEGWRLIVPPSPFTDFDSAFVIGGGRARNSDLVLTHLFV
jgi:4'-phosphopantetheinyl transferase